MSADLHEQLVGALYEAAFDPALWQPALHTLAQACRADNFHLMACPVGQTVPSYSLTWGMAPAMEASYKLYYAEIDPRRQAVQRRADGDWLACHHDFDERLVARDEFFQDYLIPNGIRYLIGSRVVRCDGVDVLFGMHRAPGRQPFGGTSVAMVQRLTSHLQRASRLWLRTENLRTQAAQGAMALDLVEVGVIGLDVAGRVKHANRIAEALFREGREIRLSGGTLRMVHGADARWLGDALPACLADRCPRSGRAGRLILTLVPLPSSGPLTDTLDTARLVLLIGADTRRRTATLGQLMQAFGLTAAEARLAQAVAAGETLAAHAEAAGVSLNTVKTQLKAVFSKTGCRRQAELARLLAAVPPARR